MPHEKGCNQNRELLKNKLIRKSREAVPLYWSEPALMFRTETEIEWNDQWNDHSALRGR